MSTFEWVPLYSHVCLRCHKRWRSLKERPGVCGFCKSLVWDQPPKRPQRKGAREAA